MKKQKRERERQKKDIGNAELIFRKIEKERKRGKTLSKRKR